MKIITFIKNNLQSVLFFGFILLIFIMFQQCNVNKKLKDEILFNKAEIERAEYNRKVDSAQMSEYIDENGRLRAEMVPYKITANELKRDYDSIFDLYQLEKGKTPETIVKWKTKVKDSIIYIPITVTDDKILLNDTANYSNGNYRILNGEIPYNILRYSKYDSLYHPYDSLLSYPTLFIDKGKFGLEQAMNLQVGFYKNENDELLFDVTTDYPGVHFNNLVGARVSDYDELKKYTENTPSPWRLGITAGYGFYIKDVVAPAPYIGIGVMYTPNFLLKKKK